MASAVSTEPAISTEICRRDDSRYTIPPHVRVRKEAFGLLFYNTENSSLTFVKSGDILRIQALPNGAKRIAASPESETQAGVRKILDHLSKKRLIGGL